MVVAALARKPLEVRAPADSIELTVQDVSPTGDGGHIAFLTDLEHARIVPIEVGEAEAITIAYRLAKRPHDRPFTHDLLDDAVRALGGEVVQVHVHTYEEGHFEARVSVRRGRSLLHLDARASDGIAVALGAGLPVWMDRSLYEAAGVTMEELLESLRTLDRELTGRPGPDDAL